jgi:hypothetical protein
MDWRLPLVSIAEHHPARAMAEASQQAKPTEVINLLAWHRGLHLITGGMALRFNRATPADLAKWAGMLKVIAAETEAVAPPAIERQNHEKVG